MIRVATRLLIVTVETIIALFLGMAIAHLGLGSVAWIFGGMGAGAIVFRIYRMLRRHPLKPNKIGRKIGQGMVGLSIGFAIANSNLLAASSRLPLFIFLTLFMLLCGSGIGYVYARISHTNLLNAMLATVPGGVATMSSIAADYGRNVSVVASVQTLRITSVILIIPLIAGTSGAAHPTTFSLGDAVVERDPTYLLVLTLSILAAWLGVTLARQFRIPGASFFGSLVVGIGFSYGIGTAFPELNFTPPPVMSLMGQLLLGMTVGEAWSNCAELQKKNLTYAMIPVALTIASGFVAATVAMSLTSWDWLTCLLVTAPGGSTEMILVALALDHHPEIVTVAHSVRLMALNLSLPLWIFLFRYWEKQTIASKHQS
ncbi:MAG: AbrB family transcriptional regulator [Cyanophyceae cyanobacterium]